MELSISGLSKTYSNGVEALKNVDLIIPTGMFGLLGPNGAGKSTLMRILATLQEADSGTAALGDIDVLKNKMQVKKLLGYLPQEFGFYPKIKAGKLLEHFAELKGVTDKKEKKRLVEELLHRVNLWNERNMKLGAFSGGMKQRFGIAVVLIGNPKLIIVDEPTAGLDPSERQRFLNLLSEIGENVVVILSTHIVEDVNDICTNMAIIDKGEILLKGEPLALKNKIKDKIWQKEIDKPDLPENKEKYDVISTRLTGGKTVLTVYSDQRPNSSFKAIDPTFEDVYFQIMKSLNKSEN